MTAVSYASDRAPGAFGARRPKQPGGIAIPVRKLAKPPLRLHPNRGMSRPIWKCLALLLPGRGCIY